jgi:tetratricopeptide (TPR) repeat protein
LGIWLRRTAIDVSRLIEQSKPGQAAEFCQQVVDLSKQLADQYPSESGLQEALSSIYDLQGKTFKSPGKLPDALRAYESARTIEKALIDAEPADFNRRASAAITDERAGAILEEQGEFQQALEHYQERLAIIERLLLSQSDLSWRTAQVETLCSVARTMARIGGDSNLANARNSLETALTKAKEYKGPGAAELVGSVQSALDRLVSQ